MQLVAFAQLCSQRGKHTPLEGSSPPHSAIAPSVCSPAQVASGSSPQAAVLSQRKLHAPHTHSSSPQSLLLSHALSQLVWLPTSGLLEGLQATSARLA
jgi:hypothetical protein